MNTPDSKVAMGAILRLREENDRKYRLLDAELVRVWEALAQEYVAWEVHGACKHFMASTGSEDEWGECSMWYGHPKFISDAISMGGGGRMMVERKDKACENWEPNGK